MEITENLLIENGFKQMAVTSWCGDGADYQLRPEDGGSRTIQIDYVLHNVDGDNDFTVRFTEWIYGKDFNSERSCSFHFGEWYPKCFDEIPCYEHSFENLAIALKLVSGVDFILNSNTSTTP